MERMGKASLVAALAMMVAACEDKKAEPPAPAVSAPAVPAPAPGLKFVVDAKSATSIDMAAPKEHIKAATEGATGQLSIDLRDLAKTTGEVKVDLASLVAKTFDDAAKNKTQTSHARTWLEVADGDEGPIPDAVKAANRYAIYEIRSVSGLSASDVTAVAATADGNDDVRKVTATVHGELAVHGHKVAREAEVEVTFRYARGAQADKPRAITVRSVKPIPVTLAEHDVKPRDGLGKLAKGAFNLLGTKVADVASVSLVLEAVPES